MTEKKNLAFTGCTEKHINFLKELKNIVGSKPFSHKKNKIFIDLKKKHRVDDSQASIMFKRLRENGFIKDVVIKVEKKAILINY